MRADEVDAKAQSLQDHLAELRTRLINCVLILIVATLICYGFSEKIFDFVRAPILPFLPEGGLIYTGPLDKFIAHLKLSVLSGLLISCPLWLYQIWLFIAPGLYVEEKKYTTAFIFSGTGLFFAGACFAYFVAMPMAFNFLMSFGGDTDKPMISIDQYMSFFVHLSFMFGVAFEMPLIIIVLGMMGIVSQQFLKKNRRYAVMTIAVIAAVITPPDLLSMILMLGPMLLLFELGVFIVGFFERKRADAMAVNERE